MQHKNRPLLKRTDSVAMPDKTQNSLRPSLAMMLTSADFASSRPTLCFSGAALPRPPDSLAGPSAHKYRRMNDTSFASNVLPQSICERIYVYFVFRCDSRFFDHRE